MRAITKKAEVEMVLVSRGRNGAVFSVHIYVKYLFQGVVVDIHVCVSISCTFNPALVSFLIVELLVCDRVVFVHDVYFNAG